VEGSKRGREKGRMIDAGNAGQVGGKYTIIRCGRGGHRPPRVLACNGAGLGGPSPESTSAVGFGLAGAGPVMLGAPREEVVQS
jgi:hypothetical protein